MRYGRLTAIKFCLLNVSIKDFMFFRTPILEEKSIMRLTTRFVFTVTMIINLALSTTCIAQTSSSDHPNIFQKFISSFETKSKDPYNEQEKAAHLARDGHYDAALSILEPIYRRNSNNLSVARDYAVVLGWAGHDQEAVTVYETLPPEQPDYVLAAIGHSYRALNQTDKALAVYELGLKNYPTNVVFAEGQIRCLLDTGDFKGALAKANDDIIKNGERASITAAKQDAIQDIITQADQQAVNLARAQNYQEAINILGALHAQYVTEVRVTRDYLSVLSWAGGHDDMVVSLYDSLQSGDQPDFVLEAVAVSYRRLNETDKALALYQEGSSKYSDNVQFVEGIIRCLADLHNYDAAIAIGTNDLTVHGQRPEILAAIHDVEKLKPKKHAHHKLQHRPSKHS